MMNPVLKYQSSKTWVIGVSGGPDSMALLHLAYLAGLNIHVVHVNYQKRQSAQRDENIVDEFCIKHQIPLSVEYPQYSKGNFQAWARAVRYQAMRNKVLELSGEGCMVAHHLDDDLETFEFQKRRRTHVNWYGLKSEGLTYGIRLVRPLLDLTKEELLAYCKTYQLDFGVDETNTSDVYVRNQLRKELSTLTALQKHQRLKEKAWLNTNRTAHHHKYHYALKTTTLKITEYQQLSEDWPMFLFEWIRLHTSHHPLSMSFIQELNRQIKNSKAMKVNLGNNWLLIKQYATLSLIETPQTYEVILTHIQALKSKYFEISLNQGDLIECQEDDFPLSIKSATGEEILNPLGKVKKLSRWFIEHKIPWEERQTWPVIYNRKHELIYVYKCGFKKSVRSNIVPLFMLK